MRAILIILFTGVALWRAAADWHATIGQGYAYRPGTLGGLMSSHWPTTYARLVDNLQHGAVPYAWDPVGAVVMSVPLALFFLSLAGWLWLGRPRAR
jgi:hypothetical protein